MHTGKVESWELVARILERVVSNLEMARASVKQPQALPTAQNRFDSSKVPAISIYDYFARIHQYADCSESCFILAFIFIDRALQKNPSFVLSMKSIHRLTLTAIVLAIKFSDDIYADNVVYSKIGGVALQELNLLEVEMLNMLQFNLFVSPQLYLQYLAELQSHFQQLQVAASQNESMAIEYEEKCTKPLNPTTSMGSIKTSPSTNEMAEA